MRLFALLNAEGEMIGKVEASTLEAAQRFLPAGRQVREWRSEDDDGFAAKRAAATARIEATGAPGRSRAQEMSKNHG